MNAASGSADDTPKFGVDNNGILHIGGRSFPWAIRDHHDLICIGGSFTYRFFHLPFENQWTVSLGWVVTDEDVVDNVYLSIAHYPTGIMAAAAADNEPVRVADAATALLLIDYVSTWSSDPVPPATIDPAVLARLPRR